MSGHTISPINNPHIKELEFDTLYHLGLDTKSNDLKSLFGDVKFVCMGGSVKRMRNLAGLLSQMLDIENLSDSQRDFCGHANRYSLFKAGPVICVNHGIGVSSMLVVLHELIKLLHHAQCTDVSFFRIGTSGGIGIDPGTVVIAETAVNECLEDYYEMTVAGAKVKRPCKFDKQIIDELKSIGENTLNFPLKIGITMTAMDFYEGQGRLDGAICEYEDSDKMAYLTKLAKAGVLNIEMEALAFGAILNKCNIKGAVVNVALLDRLKGDQVRIEKLDKEAMELRPQILVANYIKHKLAITK